MFIEHPVEIAVAQIKLNSFWLIGVYSLYLPAHLVHRIRGQSLGIQDGLYFSKPHRCCRSKVWQEIQTLKWPKYLLSRPFTDQGCV